MATNNTDETTASIQWTETPSKIWRPIRTLVPVNPLKDQVVGLQRKVTPAATAGTISIARGNPNNLLFINAVQSPTAVQGRTMSEVSVSFTTPANMTTYSTTRIWVVGYKGNTYPVLETAAPTGPINFLLESTGESVTIIGQPVAQDGSVIPLTQCLTSTVTLNGVVQAPPSPSIAQTLVAIPLGYQFSFNQVNLGSTQDVLASYTVYRSSVNDVTTAGPIRQIAHNPKVTNSVVVQDVIGNTTTYYYWVTAVNTKGLESLPSNAQTGGVSPSTPFTTLDRSAALATGAIGQNALDNPGFDIPPTANSGDVMAGWYVSANTNNNSTIAQDPSSYSGSSCALLSLNSGATIPAGTTNYALLFHRRTLPVIQGQVYKLSGEAWWGSTVGLGAGVSAEGYLIAQVYNSDGSSQQFYVGLGTANTQFAWTPIQTVFTVPAPPAGKTVSYMSVFLQVNVVNGGGSAWTPSGNAFDFRVDNISLIRAANMDDEIVDGSVYARPLAGYLANGVPYTYKGVWSSGTAYKVGDEVGYNGNYWLANVASTGSAPYVGSGYWTILGPASLDNVSDGTNYAKIVGSALQNGFPKGLTPGAQMLPNPGFEKNVSNSPGLTTNLGNICDDWSVFENDGPIWTAQREVANGQALDGGSNLYIGPTAGATIANGAYEACYVSATPIAVTPKQTLFYGGWAAIDKNIAVPTGMAVQAWIGIWFYDQNLTYITDVTQAVVATAGTANQGYTQLSGTVTVPAGACYARFMCAGYVVNNSGATYTFTRSSTSIWSDCRFDDCFMFIQVDPSNSSLAVKGSIPPVVTGKLGYTQNPATTGSSNGIINMFWNGTNGSESIVIYRADKSTTTLTGSSTSWTGLPAATFYIYPYYDEVKQGINFVSYLDAIPGAYGTNATYSYALWVTKTYQLAQYQTLQNRIPLSQGGMTVAVLTVSGGGGSGGGSGACVIKGTKVRERRKGVIRAEDVRVGDELWGPDGWELVSRCDVLPFTTFIRVTLRTDESVAVTPNHVFTMPNGKDLRADKLKLGTIMLVEDGLSYVTKLEVVEGEFKVLITCEPNHLYYAGDNEPTILTHNTIIGC